MQYLKIGQYWWSAWLIANLLLQSAHRWTIGGTLLEKNVFGNFLYQLDSLASLAIGSAWLAFPKWLLHRQYTNRLFFMKVLTWYLSGSQHLSDLICTIRYTFSAGLRRACANKLYPKKKAAG
ncbi:unnamed protein product [Gongylonema pulchrum]|uniref:Uncharacterized protein n=1 Tax=Gongylonema pulchrum TaxID=637853 RepID=A0A3P6RRU4_9BILA|nr:unnamed protein product [Gongylonema pulchrum]